MMEWWLLPLMMIGPVYMISRGARRLWDTRPQQARLAQQHRLEAEATLAREQADAAVSRIKQQKRDRNAEELTLATALTSSDRFTVHPEFVRVWRGGASAEIRLRTPAQRELIDRLGLRFDSLEHPSPTPRPRGSEPIRNWEGEVIAWSGGEHVAERRVGPLRASVISLTQAEYDALPEKDPWAFYRITDALRPTMLMRAANYDELIRRQRGNR